MCSECLQTPCHPRCPNAPEPDAVYYCERCGKRIYDGDGYYDLCDEIWCEECVKDQYHIAEV
jgi:hypothetical protein